MGRHTPPWGRRHRSRQGKQASQGRAGDAHTAATARTFRYVSAHSSELGLVSYEILLLICDRRSV